MYGNVYVGVGISSVTKKGICLLFIRLLCTCFCKSLNVGSTCSVRSCFCNNVNVHVLSGGMFVSMCKLSAVQKSNQYMCIASLRALLCIL